MLAFTAANGASPTVGYFMPENFTNQIQEVFREPPFLVVADPRVVLKKASYVNLPKLLCVT